MQPKKLSFKDRGNRKTNVFYGEDKIGYLQTHNSLTWFFVDERGHPRFPKSNRTSIWASTKERLQDKLYKRIVEANCAIYRGERLEDFLLKGKDTRTSEEIMREHNRHLNRRIGANWDNPLIEIDDKLEEREWEKNNE